MTLSVVPERIPPLEALSDGFCMVGADWRLTYCNAAAERMLGTPREELLGLTVSEAFPGANEASVRERLARARNADGPVRLPGEEIFPHAAHPFCVIVTPAEDGVALQMRAVEGDAGRSRGLLESLRHGCVAVDAAGRITYANRAARGVLGARRDAVPGTEIWALLPPEPAILRDTLRAALADGKPHRLHSVKVEAEPFRGRFFDVSTRPLADGGASILFEDVTARIERDRDLARYAAEAEEASRARARFFAAASHALRTPLHAIVGYTHLLATATFGDLPADAARAAERSSLCAEHLSRLVDDILLLSTTEIDRLRVVPVRLAPANFLHACMEPLRVQAEAKGLSFTIAAPDTLPAVESDPERLRQVLQAVVGNALKFTPRGGVRVEARTASDPGTLEFRVADTGPGIPADDRERIFQPFEQLCDPSRTDSATRGTGLGLTVARQLARRLHGTLDVEDDEATAGAVFRLRLPLDFPSQG
ncbi:MAG TPA: ATP-binding protein [Longimicrobium sp.]|nr:ATP-binding protein [Longimicrobium sp.]